MSTPSNNQTLRFPPRMPTPEITELALTIARTHELRENLPRAPTPELAERAVAVARIHETHEQAAVHAAMVAQAAAVLETTHGQAIEAFARRHPSLGGTPRTQPTEANATPSDRKSVV